MVLTALRGGLGFLSRLPVGRSESAWVAFADAPVAFPLVGYVVGSLVGAVLLVPLPPASLAFGVLVALVAVVGINQFDGVADLGDAAVVHGDPARRREVLKDTDLGVGGVGAVALVVAGLALAALALADLPALVGLGVVLAAEVGAKTAMALLACLGVAPHEGMGSTFTTRNDAGDLAAPLVASAPAALATIPSPAAAAALLAAVATGLGVRQWAFARLGGTSGDVFGATDHLARVVALHAGVVAWTLF